jgi:hypothetical protein
LSGSESSDESCEEKDVEHVNHDAEFKRKRAIFEKVARDNYGKEIEVPYFLILPEYVCSNSVLALTNVGFRLWIRKL